MKLRTKIQLYSSLFMLILIMLINTAIYVVYHKISTSIELEELGAHTNTIIKELNEHPDIAKNDLLRAYVPSDGMIRVIGKDSKSLLTLTKKPEYRELNSAYVTSESRTIIKNLAEENVAVIAKPIIWENGDIVTFQVSKHLILLEENLTRLFYVLTVASVLMLIPIIIAGNLLARFLLNPFKAFIQTMRANTEHALWKKIHVQNRSKDEIYEMEKTFNEMIDHLEDNFRKQETFVSDASHELKTPISIVKSYAQLLRRRGINNPDLFNESVEAIESEADRMQNLVEQMLLLAKNQMKADFKPVDFASICAESVKTFQGAYARAIHFQQTISTAMVTGNAEQLQQIVYILMDNALKYTEKNIDLQLIQQENQVILHVRDYGQGIAEEDLGRIFDRFYRIDKARSRETGGTGLGLPIAKAITAAHNGVLSVESSIGIGTTFTLTLPLA